jgi:hypothetical protein
MTENISLRARQDWLETLPSCSMTQYRRRIELGAEPIFILEEASSFTAPVWLLLVKDTKGVLSRVVTPTDPVVRKLRSIKQVYQVARSSGLLSMNIPVEQKR